MALCLTIHRGCASGKPLDPLAVSDAPPLARSRYGAALLRRPRQARRLSATAENERTERLYSAAFRQVFQFLFLAPRMAFPSSFFVQGHNIPKENIIYYTIFGDLAQVRRDTGISPRIPPPDRHSIVKRHDTPSLSQVALPYPTPSTTTPLAFTVNFFNFGLRLPSMQHWSVA